MNNIVIRGTIKDKFIYKYDSEGREIYSEFPDGTWNKKIWHSSGQLAFWENSRGMWGKWEFDDNGNKIRYSNSEGTMKEY